MYSTMWGNHAMIIQLLNVSDTITFVNCVHINEPRTHKNVQWNLTLSSLVPEDWDEEGDKMKPNEVWY